jgi:hypothetical protein
MEKTITGLTPDTQYGVQVRAINGPNISEWSPRFDFETANSNNAPSAVQNVAITVISDSFHIEWDRMANNPNNGNSPIIRYNLELIGNDFNPNKVLPVLQGTSSRLSYTLTFDTNMAWFAGIPRANIKVRIQAVDANGNLGDWSDQEEATNPPPGPVTDLEAYGITDAVHLEWANPEDEDLIGARIYADTSGPTFTPNPTTNLVGTTAFPMNTFEFFSSNYTTWHFVVVALDKFGSESTVLTRTEAVPLSPAVFDIDAPDVPENVQGVITTDPVTLVTKMNVTWEYPDPPEDLSEFQFRIRPVGETAWETYTLGVTWEDFPLEFILEGLQPYLDYELQARARDFIANASDWTLTETVPAANNVVPSEPDEPTAVGNTMHIQVVHNGMNFDGYPLEEDVAFLEVYANTTGTAMAYPADADNILGTIAFGPGMVQTFNIPAEASSGGAQDWYVSVLAVDRAGQRSPMSDTVPVSVGLIDTLNVSDAAITNAKIFSLEVNKLTAGSGLIADLVVKSTLTLGDATDTGYISSYNWSSGTAGWRLGKDTLEINDGTVKAGALLIQDSAQNLMPGAYASFEWLASYYALSSQSSTGQDGLYATDSTPTVNEVNPSMFGTKHLNVSATSGQSPQIWFNRLSDGATGYNIDVEEGEEYIVSVYLKNRAASSQIWKLQVKGDVSGTPTLIVDESFTLGASETSYSRKSKQFTVPAGCNKVLVGLQCLSVATKNLDVDGVQLERQISALNTPSPWKPPGFTSIDGGGIVTGFIRSSEILSVNGTDQPAWFIDMEGDAQFGIASIRGHMIVGPSGGSESDSYIASGNYTSTVGWKIIGNGNADFANITSRHSSGSVVTIGTTEDSTSGMQIFPPSGVVNTNPAKFQTTWYTHADFGPGAEVQIHAPLRTDWATTPAYIRMSSFATTSTKYIEMFSTYLWMKGQYFGFADNLGNRVEFKHKPTVGGYDDGFAFVGASEKKITFDFDSSINTITSRDSANDIQRLYIDAETLNIRAANVSAGPDIIRVGPINDRMGLHNGTNEDSGSNTVALYYGLDGGGFGSLKATNFSGTVNRKFEAQEFVVTSDVSMKKNEKKVTGALGVINAIPVYDYDFNMGDDDISKAKKKDFTKGRGVLAQDVAAVLPSAVQTNPVDGTLSVQMYALLSTTMAALQETSARLEALEAAVEPK